MINKNCVVFKGNKDGINIVLDKETSFNILATVLSEKLIDAVKLFSDSKTAITFSGRDLSDKEEDILLDIIIKSSNLNISFLVNEGEKKILVKEKKSHREELLSHQMQGNLLTMLSAHENNSIYHRGSLRSGQSIRYSGSVIIIGDVNPGAEVVADGNIIVLGMLKGFAHAGSKGNAECFIAALNLIPTQMRIAEVITYIPPEMVKKNKDNPSFAYIEDHQIFIVPLLSR